MFWPSWAIVKFSIKQVEAPYAYKYDPAKHDIYITLILILFYIYIVLS